MNTALSSGPQLTYSAQQQFDQPYSASSFSSYPAAGNAQQTLQTQPYASTYPPQPAASSAIPTSEESDDLYGASPPRSPGAREHRRGVPSHPSSHQSSRHAGPSSRRSHGRGSEDSQGMGPPALEDRRSHTPRSRAPPHSELQSYSHLPVDEQMRHIEGPSPGSQWWENRSPESADSSHIHDMGPPALENQRSHTSRSRGSPRSEQHSISQLPVEDQVRLIEGPSPGTHYYDNRSSASADPQQYWIFQGGSRPFVTPDEYHNRDPAESRSSHHATSGRGTAHKRDKDERSPKEQEHKRKK